VRGLRASARSSLSPNDAVLFRLRTWIDLSESTICFRVRVRTAGSSAGRPCLQRCGMRRGHLTAIHDRTHRHCRYKCPHRTSRRAIRNRGVPCLGRQSRRYGLGTDRDLVRRTRGSGSAFGRGFESRRCDSLVQQSVSLFNRPDSPGCKVGSAEIGRRLAYEEMSPVWSASFCQSCALWR
jgi:hypothetical protein